MKTAEEIKTAVSAYTRNLRNIRDRIADVTAWLDAASFMQCQELFIAQVKERDDLRRRESEMEFRIKFANWVLETTQNKGNENE